jgi:LytS/YehU family sensor histidine kinase
VLHLQVRDTGPGLAAPDELAAGSHLGLKSTRERLEHLYGDAQQLRLQNHEDGGAMVSMAIPWHTEPLAEAGS